MLNDTRHNETLSTAGVRYIRGLLRTIRTTPLHPQWFVFHGETNRLRKICSRLTGLVADIGCADAKPRRFLPSDSEYIGIDYYATAINLYRTRPTVFADAQSLPLANASIDHALLLEVLEHLPDPDRCLAEIHRALKPGGDLIISVPFIYPIHDAPLDFHRWTRFGLLRAAERHGYSVREENLLGHPLESAALITNIALSGTALRWLRSKNILGVTVLLLPFAIFLINIAAWVGARLSKSEPMMPFGYQMTWTKQ